MENRVLAYYVKHKAQVNHNIELYFRDKEDIEAIHNLRLSMKRLKVLLYQMEYLSEKEYRAKEALKYLDRLFKKAGVLRDVQVQRELFEEYSKELDISLDSYLKYLSKNEQDGKAGYEKAMKEFDIGYLDRIEKQIIDILSSISGDVVHYKAAIFMGDKLKSIKNTYYKSNEEMRFHKIRRHLKDINYLNNITGGKLPVAKAMHISEERLSELGTLLGEWHDKVNALIFLKSYKDKAGKLGTTENSLYSKVYNHIEQQKKSEYLKLNSAFKKELKI
jgi:CHAD domain-containing protein